MVCNTKSMDGICFYSLVQVTWDQSCLHRNGHSSVTHPLFFKPLTTRHTHINSHTHTCTHEPTQTEEHTHIIFRLSYFIRHSSFYTGHTEHGWHMFLFPCAGYEVYQGCLEFKHRIGHTSVTHPLFFKTLNYLVRTHKRTHTHARMQINSGINHTL